MSNIDHKTVEGFGQEWSHFDQSAVPAEELREGFERYFHIFPWHSLPANSVGFDLGCGSGRWARLVAPRVGTLHCIDPSEAALDVARRNLKGHDNCRFHLASVDAIPLDDGSMDFGYSLGVLHHIPDTAAGLRACVRKLRVGAPFLVYLYYALDNRPSWFRFVWRASDVLRGGISRLPFSLRHGLSEIIAAVVYYPLAQLGYGLERLGWSVEHIPLSAYRRKSFYTMRTDALDRFGTRLEQRFTAEQMRAMMERAGLEDIAFSQSAPYWCAVGRAWSRDRILSELSAAGLPALSGSCSEIYLEKTFDGPGLRPETRLPTAQELGATSLMFPVHPTLEEAAMRATADGVARVMERASR